MKLNKISIGLFSMAFVFIANSNFVMAYTKKELNCRELYTLTKVVEPDCKDVLDSKGNIRKKTTFEPKENPKSKQNIDIPMIYVDGGTFQMGSNEGESNEKPVHKVTLNSFYIGKYEVTQKEYKYVMGSNPSRFKGDNLPVESVSFSEAIAFCNKYNEMKGLAKAYDSSGNIINWKSYRLPTEAEWEFAARGGNSSMSYKYSGSDNPNEIAWYDKNSNSKTHTIGAKKPNELGIYDMSGNVWELVSDWYDSDYYSKSPLHNPYNNVLSYLGFGFERGGGWYGNTEYLRSSSRKGYAFTLNFRLSGLGFRLLRNGG